MIKNDVEILLGEKVENFEFSLSKLDKTGKLDQRMMWKLLGIIFRKLDEMENNAPESEKPKEPEKVGIYNPDTEDFICTRREEDNKSVEYTIPGVNSAYFEPKLAEYIKNKLAVYLMNKRTIKTNYDDDFKEVLKEISIEI